MEMREKLIYGKLRRRILRPADKRREYIGFLVITFFVFIIAEGILRKWLLNGLQQQIFFMRDFVLIAIYYYYIRSVKIWKKVWVVWWVLAAAMVLCLVLMETLSSPLPILVYLIGFRNYIIYIPLTFIMRDILTERHVQIYLKCALLLTVPVAFLVVIQFFSPPAADINRGLSSDVAGRFLVAEGIVRPYGPFTFVAAQATFSILSLCNVIVALERRVDYGISWRLWGLATISSLTMGALSGARTYFIGAAAVMAIYLFAGITAPRLRRGAARLGSAGLIAVGFFLLLVFVFPTSFRAISERQEASVHAEGSTASRAFSMFTSVLPAIADAKPLGVGLGAGSNAGAALRGDNADWSYGEYDWPRAVTEIGAVAGLTYISFRIGMFLWLFSVAFRANRLTGDASALAMFGIAGPTVLVAQVTGQNQMLSFCWFTCGLTFFLAKNSLDRYRDRRSASRSRKSSQGFSDSTVQSWKPSLS